MYIPAGSSIAATLALNNKTDAIVLRLAPHNEKAHMLHLFTRSHGRVQFLVYGLHSKKKQGTKALLEPLSHIHIEAVFRDNAGLGQLRECAPAYVAKALSIDNTRRCVALFISEILYRTLTHPMQDEALFSFIEQTVRELDTCTDPQNVHIRFLIRYAELLGFGIDPDDPANRSAAFLPYLLALDAQPQHSLSTLSPSSAQPQQPHLSTSSVQQPVSVLFPSDAQHSLSTLSTSDAQHSLSTLSASDVRPLPPRREVLHALMQYYTTHIPDFSTPNSLSVLEAVFE